MSASLATLQVQVGAPDSAVVDFLEALGANLALDNKAVASVIEECGYGFLFAQVGAHCLIVVMDSVSPFLCRNSTQR